MNLLQNYKKIVDKIKEHIKTELEKRYKDIRFDNVSDFHFLCFSIKEISFELSLENKIICISFYIDEYNNDLKCIETFEEVFKYIDDVISEEY